MQTQDAPTDIMFHLWPWLEANKNRLIAGGLAVVVVSGVAFFFSSQREQRGIDAGTALTTLMITPTPDANQMAASLEQMAAQYSGTPAAVRAELQAAGTLYVAGKYADAQAQFEKFLSTHPSGPLAATAQLGFAASLDAQDKMDQAAGAYRQVSSVFPGAICVAEAEFGLGSIAERQNKLAEAKSHYEAVLHSPAGMGGSLAQEAYVRMNQLEAKIAATTPKVSASTTKPMAEQPATAPQTPVKP